MIRRLLTTTVLAAAGVLAMSCVMAAQTEKSTTPDAAGHWSLSVTSPHGDVTMTLDLTQDGRKVRGTLDSEHTGKRSIAGEFDADSSLKLTTTTGGSDEQFTLVAKVKDRDALTGYLSTSMGDLNFSGKRERGK